MHKNTGTFKFDQKCCHPLSTTAFERAISIATILLVAILCAASWPASTHASTVPERGSNSPTVAQVEAYVDAYMAKSMEKNHIIGATISVVHNGKTLFSKGYGYENIVTKRRVSSSDTLFMIGSITKLFTATATMQLYERGQVSLTQDVSKYLDFKFSRYSKKPITMAHLMTHTAGFEESTLGFVAKKSEVKPLGEMLKLTLPRVRLVREPGVASSYSNHGVALEGYVVERASGMSYPDYIKSNIFNPLDMTSSTAVEPLPADRFRRLASGYVYEEGKHRLLPEDVINLGPAGFIASTADDMAKFMIAHLSKGQVGSAPLMKPEAMALMHRCHFTSHRLVQGCNAYGFQNSLVNGNPTIQHNGGTFNFLSNLVLVPGEDFGVFISVNTVDDGGLNDKFPKAIIGKFFGKAPPLAGVDPAPYTDNIADYAGYYAPMRRAYGGWLKLAGLGAAQVNVVDGNKLRIEGSDLVWDQVGNGVFRSKDKKAEGLTVVFQRDRQNNVVGANIGDGFDKVPVYATPAVAFPLLIAFAIFAVAFGLLSVLARKRMFAPDTGVQSIRGWMNGGLVLTLCGLAIIVVFSSNEQLAIGYAPPIGAHIMIWVFNAAVVAFLVGAYRTFVQWGNPHWTLIGRIITVSYIVAAISFCWFLWQWELIGISAWGR
jgi:CubicO group peptidase (beta-lactamase class C family)